MAPLIECRLTVMVTVLRETLLLFPMAFSFLCHNHALKCAAQSRG